MGVQPKLVPLHLYPSSVLSLPISHLPVDGAHGALVLRPYGLVERGVQRVDVLPLLRRRPLQLVGQRLQHDSAVPQRRLDFLNRLQKERRL